MILQNFQTKKLGHRGIKKFNKGNLPIFFCFSGEISGVGVAIEDCTSKVWDMVFQPIFTKVSLLSAIRVTYFVYLKVIHNGE